MNLDLITNEIFNQLMEKIKQQPMACDQTISKKFLQCEGEAVTISGVDQVFFDDIKDEKDYLRYEFLVIGKLTIDEMAATVNGLANNNKTMVLRQFLLNGKRVYVIEEGLEHRLYKDISNPEYYTVFREYEKQLNQFGVRIMSSAALRSVLAAEGKLTGPEIDKEEKMTASKNTHPSSSIEYSTEKKLITNELAKKLAVHSPIILKPGTLITPYAQDVFRENKTTITFI